MESEHTAWGCLLWEDKRQKGHVSLVVCPDFSSHGLELGQLSKRQLFLLYTGVTRPREAQSQEQAVEQVIKAL